MEQPIKGGAAPVVVACVGDSITEGIGATSADRYSYPAQLQGLLGEGYAVHNYGASGMTLLAEGDYPYIRQERYAASLACPCDAVILMLGTNDSKPQNWRLRERYLSELIEMIRTYQSLPSRPQVYVATSPAVFQSIDGITDGVVSGEIAPLQKEAARHTGCRVIDINALTRGHEAWTIDGIHPNDEGYAHLAGAFAQVLSKALPTDRRKTYD